MPEGASHDAARVFITRVQKHHWHWFFGRRERADNPFRPPDWYPPDDAYLRQRTQRLAPRSFRERRSSLLALVLTARSHHPRRLGQRGRICTPSRPPSNFFQ